MEHYNPIISSMFESSSSSSTNIINMPQNLKSHYHHHHHHLSQLNNNMDYNLQLNIDDDDDYDDHKPFNHNNLANCSSYSTDWMTATSIGQVVRSEAQAHDHDDHDHDVMGVEEKSMVMMKKGSSSSSSDHDNHDHEKTKTNNKSRKARFAFQTRSQVDILDDGYRWRKYGQKAVKNNKFPRSYYRCTHQNCNVKKQVQRLSKDQGIVVTTYEGVHSHPIDKPTDNFEHILTQMQIYTSI